MDVRRVLKNFQHIFLFVILFLLFGLFSSAHATSFELIAPTETLTRGQSVSFTANIDTQGETLTTATVGLSYKTEYLQYESATPGDTFETLTASEAQTGTIVLEGSNTNGFSGTGTFAVITFKLIADSPGETELCTLTTPPAPSTTPPPGTTTQPAPTALPTTGQIENTITPIIVGLGFISISLVLLISTRNRRHHRLHK